MPSLAGLHDRSAANATSPDTWVVDTIALSENPTPPSYDASRNWIGRLNWGYGSTGTLPHPQQYPEMANRAASYVVRSSGCSIWIVGNETNLRREWPNGVPISPQHYADCYRQVRRAIRSQPGHENDQVLIAAPGPWNDEYKYPGNERGDWIKYLLDVIDLLDGEFDGVSFHAYTHGYNVALVTSTACMDAPFQDRFYEFLAYRDFCHAIREAGYGHLPTYLTEANGNGPWQAVGLIPAMLAEINWWNESGNLPLIRCVVFYRYSSEDAGATFEMGNKPDVMAEYHAAVARGFTAQGVGAQSTVTTHIPAVYSESNPLPEPSLPPRDIDERLYKRGMKIDPGTGEEIWELYEAEWVPSDQSGGRHNIYVEAYDENGNAVDELPFQVKWDGGPNDIIYKTNGKKGFDAGNFPMTPGAFDVWINDGKHDSDAISGIKMGEDTPGGWNAGHHTSTILKFRRRNTEATTTPPPVEPPTKPPVENPPPVQPPPSAATRLIWPTDAPRTQRWGENPTYYQGALKIPYHNGIDHGAAMGTPVRAMADGEVMFIGSDPGYGLYVRVYHPALGIHSFIAHLKDVIVEIGQKVTQGQTIAHSGASGMTAASINADGTADTSRPAPHTHTEIRLGSRDAYAEGTFGHSNGRVDPETAMYVINHIVGGAGAQAAIIDPIVAEALLAVESNGEGFEDGRLKIRMEAHILDDYMDKATFAKHFRYDPANILHAEYRSDENSPWVAYHELGQDGEWAAFELARRLNSDAALMSTSMGAPQIMGFHHADIGYPTPQAMFEAFDGGINPQIIGFYNLLNHKGLAGAMQRRDWGAVVRGYNGRGLESVYVPRLIAAYERLRGA